MEFKSEYYILTMIENINKINFILNHRRSGSKSLAAALFSVKDISGEKWGCSLYDKESKFSLGVDINKLINEDISTLRAYAIDWYANKSIFDYDFKNNINKCKHFFDLDDDYFECNNFSYICKVIRAIKGENPKIIYLVRNPYDIIKSKYAFMSREDIINFFETHNINTNTLEYYHNKFKYILDILHENKINYKIILFDDLITKPQETVNEIFKWFSINKKIKLDKFPREPEPAFKDRNNIVNLKLREEFENNENLVKNVKQYYKEDVIFLSNILQRNLLEEWKW